MIGAEECHHDYGAPPLTHDVRKRVRNVYGERVASALTASGDGWLLTTPAGNVRFFKRTTHFLQPQREERRRAARAEPGRDRKEGTPLVVSAGSHVERELIAARLGQARPQRGPAATPSGTRKKKAWTPAPPPDPCKRAIQLLALVGVPARAVDGRPLTENFAGQFRRVPNYGLCLDARNANVHFLATETRIFTPTKLERSRAKAAKIGRLARGDYLRLPAASFIERDVVSDRLRRLISRDPLPPPSSDEALATPLGQVIARHLPGWTLPPLNLFLLENGSISLRDGVARRAVVHPDRATAHGRTLRADFLADGQHWNELASLLTVTAAKPTAEQRASRSTAPALPRPSGWRPEKGTLPEPHRRPREPAPATRRVAAADDRRRLSDPPAGIDGELLDLCLDASRAIRLERNVVFPYPVELASDGWSIKFLPLDGHAPRVRAPFELDLGPRGKAVGAILLWTVDPLDIVFELPPLPGEEARVWASALLAFRDLTVWPELEHATPRQPRRLPTTTRRLRSREPERRLPRSRRRYEPRRRGLSLAELRAHMVIGHRRNLPPGQSASTEKIREAAALGISLAAGQTWVREHARGAGFGHLTLVRVRWAPPEALLAFFSYSVKRC